MIGSDWPGYALCEDREVAWSKVELPAGTLSIASRPSSCHFIVTKSKLKRILDRGARLSDRFRGSFGLTSISRSWWWPEEGIPDGLH